MTGRSVALVTGANKGIGLEMARQLARAGCAVWIGARDAVRGEDAAAALRHEGADARFVALDVTDDDSVRDAAATIGAASGRLDILINNAGVALDRRAAPSALGMADLRATYEVNVFGPVRVTQAFLPLLRAAREGRIVMISSGLGSMAHQTNPSDPYFALNVLAYRSSKSSLNAVTVAFAKELAATAIKVNAADPGFTATDLNQHRGTQTIAEGAAIGVRLALLPPDGPTGGFFSSAGPEPW